MGPPPWRLPEAFPARLFLPPLRHLALQAARQLVGRELQADVERAELAVPGAGLVEAHLVHELLEDDRVVREEVDAPLPVVEPDRARDDLVDRARVVPSDHAV